MIAGVGKIAVLRANAIGDFVFALPALAALRAAYPRAEIVLLGLAWHAELLAGRPGAVDRVVVVPGTRGVSAGPETHEDPQALARFFAAMQAERWDLALQMHGGGRHSNPFVRRLGARVTAGLATPDAEPLDLTLPYVYFQPEIVRYIEVAGLVGAPPATLEPALEVLPRDVQASLAVVPGCPRPLALLNPGATDARRRWPVEKFADVGRALDAAGAQVVVNGSDAERELCESLVRRLAGRAIDTSGRLSLSALLGLVSRCAVVVSNDTGPLHLAAATGTPAVGIYWCFNLVNSSQILRARHRPFVSWQTRCPVCGEENIDRRCPHDVSFVADVPAQDVARAALALLDGHRAARPPRRLTA